MLMGVKRVVRLVVPRVLAPLWKRLPEPLQWWVLWLLNPKYAVGVSGVVFNDAGQVLLLKHTFRRRYPWGVVSGWINGGESLEGALQREIAEETKLRVRIERLVMVRTDKLHLFLEAVYACRFEGGTFVPSNEVTEVVWCSPDGLPTGVHPDHGPLVQRAAAALAERSR
jgi:8-oxo-dGTP diphosphatase